MKRLDDRKYRKPSHHGNKQDKRLGLGIIFIFIGAIFILSNTGMLPNMLRHYIFSWQMILIVVGLFSIAGKKNKTAGLIMITIGVFFIMPGFFGFERIGLGKLWPAIFVIIGASILLRRRHDTFGNEETNDEREIETKSENVIDDLNIFSGTSRNIASQNFRGGRVTCIFGGADYNFHNAGLADNRALLDVLAIFGGTKIIVPSDWAVTIDIVSIFGGFVDKRNTLYDSNLNTEKRLIIKGFTIFGGGEVRSS